MHTHSTASRTLYRCYGKRLSLIRRTFPTQYMLALVLSDLGDASQASQITDDVLKRWPDDVYANSLAAVVHLSRGNKDAAVRYAQKSLELDPQQLSGESGSLMTLTDADQKGKTTLRRAHAMPRSFPQLLSPELPIDRVTYLYAIDLATRSAKDGRRRSREGIARSQ